MQASAPSRTDRSTAARERRRIAWVAWPSLIVSTIGINVLGLALPIFILQIYDRVLPNESRTTLSVLAIWLTLALLMDLGLRLLRATVATWTAARLEHALRLRAVSSLLATSLTAFQRKSPGAYLESCAAIPQVRDYEAHQKLVMGIDLAFALFYLALIAYLGIWLVAVPLGLIALSGLCTFVFGGLLRHTARAQMKADRNRFDFLVQALTGALTIKALALNAQMLRRHEAIQETSSNAVRELMMRSAAVQTLGGVATQLNTIALLALGAILVLHGEMSLGALAACSMLSGRSLQPIQACLSMWANAQSIRIARGEVDAIIALPPEQAGAARMMPLEGRIELDRVSFRYTPDGPLLLDDITLHAAPGEIIGIEGGSGSGKTALLQIILGLLKPESGNVRFDGHDLEALALDAVRRQTALLPREGAVFSGTILDNLSGYRDGECVNEALYLAFLLGLNEPVRRLPQGFDTPVEQANKLPAGLRQRVAIVRALVDAPKVILFDEADYGLDVDSRARLIALLQELGQTATLILVSRNAEILAIAQRRFRLRNGKLIPVASLTLAHTDGMAA